MEGTASKGWVGLWKDIRGVCGVSPAPPPGFAFSLQDLLGLLLLFPVAAHVAEGAEVRGLRYRGPSRGMNKAQSRKMDRGE